MKKIINDGTNIHYITNKGVVLSYFNNKEKELKTQIDKKGYEKVKLNGRTYSVHRLVAEAFIANPDNLPQVNHIDGNKQNNDVSNLEWCDNSFNQKHAWDNNLQQKRHAVNCSLTQEQANNVREEYKNGTIITPLANKYNVSKTTIKDILNGKYYNLDRNIAKITREQDKQKLSYEEAEEIRYLFNRYKPSYNELAKCYGVNHKCVIAIIQNKRYKKKCND